MRMLIGSMLALIIALSGSVATAHTVRIVGYLENATILPIGLAMKAKMDTGADVTLIHAVDIVRTAYAHGSGRESLPPDVEVEVRAGERVECSLYVPADGATT